MSKRNGFTAILLFVLIALPAQGARDAAMRRGFSADAAYSTNDVDSVNAFSGNLSIRIPLGTEYSSGGSLKYRFNLVYNSNVWDYFAHTGAITVPEGFSTSWVEQYGTFFRLNNEDYGPGGSDPNADGAEAIPGRAFNAGLGWMVTLGEMRTKYALNGVAQVVYIGADGAEHAFYSALHGTASETQTKSNDTTGLSKVYFYTRDGSYIRMRVGTDAAPTDQNWREIHFPDGVVQRFHCVKDCNRLVAQWVLKEMGDPYGNLLVVDRLPSHERPAPTLTGPPNWTWTFTEYLSATEGYKRAGDPALIAVRSHDLRFRVTRSWAWTHEVRLEEIELAAYANDGQYLRAKYTLGYRMAELYRDRESSWWALSGADPIVYPSATADDRIHVSLLESVGLPPNAGDESTGAPSGQWGMRYWGDDCTSTPRPNLPSCDATPFFSTRHWGQSTNLFRVNQVYGRLKELRMPTRNAIQYEYAQRGYPQKDRCAHEPGPNPGAFTSMFGVSRRQLMKHSGGTLVPDGKPTLYFARSYALPLSECKPLEFVTTVVDPPHVAPDAFDSASTKTRVTVTFHSLYNDPADAACSATSGCWTVREHGLPISHKKQKAAGGVIRGLSSSVYECQASLFYDSNGLVDRVRRIVPHNLLAGETATCGQPKRSAWVRYDVSSTPECLPEDLGRCGNANRRQASSLTEYYDDKFSLNCESYDGAGCDPVYTVSDSSNFDGMGNYRRVVSDGNLLQRSDASSTRSDRRIELTNYNPSLSYDPPTPPSAYPAVWILGLSTESFVTQDGASNVKKTKFDPATGFLQATRTLKNTAAVDAPGTAATDPKDFLMTRLREVSGQDRVIVTDYFYGGDAQSLPDGGFTAPSGWVYALEKTTRGGATEKIAYKGKCGEVTDPVIELNDVDSASGLVKSSTDEFGATTFFRYDLLGRIAALTPPALSEAQKVPFLYDYPRLTSEAAIIAMTRAGGEGAEWHYDGYGRLVETREDVPPGRNKRVTTYTMTGLPATVSSVVAQNADATADVLSADYTYDIFGRATKYVPPGGKATSQTLRTEYQGIREVKREQEGLAVGAYDAHGTVGTAESFDSHGRLIAVDQNTGQNAIRTRYEYDASDRLTKVRSPQGGNSDRRFRYDGRGLLIEEEHPELAGKAVKWRGYDARGNAGIRKIGTPNVQDDSSYTPFDVAFRYDCSELMVSVRQLSTNKPLKSFAYQGGKLREASRQNYVVDPRATSQSIQIPVKTIFEYDPIGRVTKKTLNAGLEVSVENQYDNLGRLTQVKYSPLTGCSGCPVAQSRVFAAGYQSGSEHLNTIQQTAPAARAFVSGISYHPNEHMAELTRGNLLKDVFTMGDDALPRPVRIQVLRTSGTSGGWETTVGYDAAGTVEAMGPARFRYDRLRRLTGMKMPSGAVDLEQVYGYDIAGNLTNMGGTAIPVDAATNRIASSRATYDLAGNVTKITDPRRANFELRFSNGSESWYDPLNMPRRLEAYANGALAYGRVFLYDASDERVAVLHYGSPGTDDEPSLRELWTFRGMNNEVLREFERVRGVSPQWRWTKDYVYAGSRLIAGIQPAGGQETVHHYHTDHLGSIRYVTDVNGNAVDIRTYWAFGEEVNPRPDSNRRKFTGHERDDDGTVSVVGDLDYMHARYYANLWGRFLSIDRHPGDARRPVTWNRYAYVTNNPVTLIDPTGNVESAPQADGDDAARRKARASELAEVKREATAKGDMNASGKAEPNDSIIKHQALEDDLQGFADLTMGFYSALGAGDFTATEFAEDLAIGSGDLDYKRRADLVNKDSVEHRTGRVLGRIVSIVGVLRGNVRIGLPGGPPTPPLPPNPIPASPWKTVPGPF